MKSLEYNINPQKLSFLHKIEDESFTEIKEFPQRQFLVSNLSRGVISAVQIIADPVYDVDGKLISTKYFSHHQKLEKIEPEDSSEQAYLKFQADVFLLENIFQSRDHKINNPKNYQENPNKQIEHLNVIVNTLPEDDDKSLIWKSQFNKYTLFDFGKALIPNAVHWENDHDSVSIPEERRRFINNIKTLSQVSPWCYDEKQYKKFIATIITKAKILLTHQFNDYKLFDAVIKKGNINLTTKEFNVYFEKNFINQKADTQEEREKLMFNEMQTRIQLICDTTEEILKEV